jgi:hypothetical protein
MKKPSKKRGPVPDVLKIGGVGWKDAMKTALGKKKPPEGWPKPEPKRKKKSS